MKKFLSIVVIVFLLSILSAVTVNAQDIGWTNTENGWQYITEEGALKGKEFTINDSTYLFNDNGYITVGFYSDSKNTYYYSMEGDTPEEGLGKKTKGIVPFLGSIYYFDDNYSMAYGWQTVNDKKYYFDTEDGTALKGFQIIDGNKYYFDYSTGEMQTGWRTIDGKRFYFFDNGAAAKGMLKDDKGKRYYFGDNCVMQKGWKNLSGKIYYFQINGDAATNGIKTISGKKYYFSSSGTLITGWRNVNNKNYYFATTGKLGVKGAAYTGLKAIGKNKYYFDKYGVMKTGVQGGGKSYYFLSPTGKRGTTLGAMKKGWITYKNNTYFARANGVLYRNEEYSGYKFGKNCVLTAKSKFIRSKVLAVVKSQTKGKKTAIQKLYALYKYTIRTTSYKKLTLKGTDEYYAYNAFKFGNGNCYSFASKFAFLAREIGYKGAKVIRGYCPAYGGGWTPHGWVEIKFGKTPYTFDPDLEHETNRDGFKKTYGKSVLEYRK